MAEAALHLESPDRIERGTPAFRRTNLAIFSAGFGTFWMIYCVQPLMPFFSRAFHVDPVASSLTLSLTTGLLAGTVMIAGSLSETWGRKPMMVVSLLTSALLATALAFVPGWHGLLALRTMEGLTFAGVPAVAMAYLSEEMSADAIGLAMGLYIGGSGLGGMSGRLVAAALTDFVSWRVALGTIGALGVGASIVFWRSLPPSRHFHRRALSLRATFAAFGSHVRDLGLALLFVEGFLIMGSFVTVYNYITYRLVAPPYSLSQALVGSIFIVYLVGVVASPWVGHLAGKLGRRPVLMATIALMLGGIALTLLRPLPLVIVGIAVVTFGFFGAHSVASSWVGLRARHSRAQASALYLFFYYLGSSVVGSSGGVFWNAAGWLGVAGFVGALLAVALLISMKLASIPSPPPSAPLARPFSVPSP